VYSALKRTIHQPLAASRRKCKFKKKMTVENIVKWGNANPKKLFLIDGFGAIVSAILLGIVLVKLQSIFGIPKSTLYFLASIPCFFAFYDFYCYYKIDKKVALFLKGIAIANLIYCCLSVGLAIYHIEEITKLGWIYILTEILIVCGLAFIELKVAKSQLVR
jgi:drug/metabolite transporter (DMT)-like permease